MILQKDLGGKSLAGEIVRLIESPDRISAMEKAAKQLAKSDAAKVTVDIIEELAERE